MTKTRLIGLVILLIVALVVCWRFAATRSSPGSSVVAWERSDPTESTGMDVDSAPSERSFARRQETAPSDSAARTSSKLPTPPTSAAEFQELVRWMKGLSREELLQLTNAEFGFQKSELITMLQNLEGDWVIDEMQRLAIGATDDLVRATLTVGLFGGFSRSRMGDPRLLTAAQGLLPHLVSSAEDPFGSATALVMGVHMACLRQKQDLGQLLLPHLAESDNPALLTQGYLFVGATGNAGAALSEAILHHPHAEGRMGALEGLRNAATSGRIPPEDLVRVSREALAQETSERNQLLIIEMIGGAGGQVGIDALDEIVRSKDPRFVGAAASTLAARANPDRALATLSSALQDSDISEEQRGELYQALGVIESTEAGQQLLAVAQDARRSDAERLDGLRGLWHRPMDDELAGELGSIINSDAPGAMRAESLKMLSMNANSTASVDIKDVATNDKDDAVRREAVLLGALQGGTDSREWLEERLLNDRSPDVKAAALGAMVMQAHYTGDGDAVLDHLSRVRKLTDDPQMLEMIGQGESMVRSYDPRRFELELKADAELYGTISKYTSGAAQRDMERRSRYLERMVQALGPHTQR